MISIIVVRIDIAERRGKRRYQRFVKPNLAPHRQLNQLVLDAPRADYLLCVRKTSETRGSSAERAHLKPNATLPF